MDLIGSLPLLQIHVTAVFITLAIVAISDLHGLLWLTGRMSVLPHARMEFLHRATWTGLVMIMCAGASMFISYPDYLLSLWAFRFKLAFVTALFINAFLIGKHLGIASSKPFSALSATEKRSILLSAAVSSIGWVGAFICAQFLS